MKTPNKFRRFWYRILYFFIPKKRLSAKYDHLNVGVLLLALSSLTISKNDHNIWIYTGICVYLEKTIHYKAGKEFSLLLIREGYLSSMVAYIADPRLTEPRIALIKELLLKYKD